MKKVNTNYIVPSKAVNLTSYNLSHTSKSIHSTSRNKVVKGRGFATATLAIPTLQYTESSSKIK